MQRRRVQRRKRSAPIRADQTTWRVLLFTAVFSGAALAAEGDATTADKPGAFLDRRITELRRDTAQNTGNFEPRFHLARLLHLKGARGDTAAAKEALRRFKKLHQAYPDRPAVTAYLGGAQMVTARRQFFPWEQKAKVDKAIALLNTAVDQAKDPDHTRLLRGIALLHPPKALGQHERAENDLKWSVQHAPDRLQAGRIEPALAATAHFHRGRMLFQQKEITHARQHSQQGAAMAPDSYAGHQATARLNDTSDR